MLNSQSNFQSIWEYEIQENCRIEFLEAYGSDGLWVKLFKQCEGYINTELKQDFDQPNRFVTIDYWKSYSTFSAMKHTISDAYNILDKQCEAYTVSENHVGFFSSE